MTDSNDGLAGPVVESTASPTRVSPGEAWPEAPWAPGAVALVEHWGLVLSYGLLCVVLGVVLAVWPGETLVVCAVIIAVQLLVSGVWRVSRAIFTNDVDGGTRLLQGISGAVALIVGLLCLRDPLQTLLAIGLILGVWWVISGVMDIVGAVAGPGRRGWDIGAGLISVLAGVYLLVEPDLSLQLLVIVICVWLFAIGFMAVVTALQLRSVGRQQAPTS